MTKEQIEALGITFVEGMTDDEVVAKITEKNNAYVAKEKSNKALIDKYSTEIASYKKEKEAKLTDEEKVTAHIKELEDNLAKAQKENAVRSKVEAYMGIGYSKEIAQKVADAEIEGKDASKYHLEALNATKEALKAELMKGNPDVKGGGGNGGEKTVEDKFKEGKLSMAEMNELKQNNPALYDRLLKL